MPNYLVTFEFAEPRTFAEFSKIIEHICPRYLGLFEKHTWLISYPGTSAELFGALKACLDDRTDRLFVTEPGWTSWMGPHFKNCKEWFIQEGRDLERRRKNL